MVIYENAIVSTGSVKQPFKFSPPMLLMRYCDGILVPLLHEVIFMIYAHLYYVHIQEYEEYISELPVKSICSGGIAVMHARLHGRSFYSK